MCTRSKFLSLALLGACGLLAQSTRLDPHSTLHITLPEDAPVTVLSADWGESSASPRGGAMLLDLHTSLSLRNSQGRRIRGITLLVTAQEVTPGGKASVSVPSLNIGPGEAFPIRIDLRLLRPLQLGNGPLVQVGLDGVLFDDLSFYGPNKLNCRRSMTVWELEARRDRKHFKSVLEASGGEALRTEMLASLERQAARAGMDARVARAGRGTNTVSERQIQFAFLQTPDSPVRTENGMMRVAADEARSPRLSFTNKSDKTVRALEIGWMIKDSRGKEYVAGSIPVELDLAPQQKTMVIQDVAFKFSEPNGQAIHIEGMTGFVSSVEYTDGRMWIPSRASKLPTPSPEEQRLAELYRKRGLNAVVEELRKF
ncbi:MAG TPA: hypothetical protein VMZ52_08735 [Bryobacteraceae bacterium]|nr:hypothetical protein [Bryobacteraceae bacterium]